jgi:hypothetical protein
MENNTQPPVSTPTSPQMPVKPTVSPNKSNLLIISLVIVEIVTLLIACYFAYQFNQLKKASNNQTSVAPSTQPIVTSPQPSSASNNETNNWNTYTNNKFKYEFKFPSSWEYSRGPGNLSDAELSNQRDIDLYVSGNLPPGDPGTGITVKVNELDGYGNAKNCTTLEDCIEKSFSWLPKTQEVENGETMFLGQPAKTIKYTRVTSLYSQTWKYVFVILNNNFYSISLSSETGGFSKNLATFDKILSTFKLTQ